jgi:uncharacterized phage infection (PIP) family protein YhgE
MAGQIDNLKAFIGVVTEAIEEIGETQPNLASQGETLETLRQEVADEVGGLDDDLDAAHAALDALADRTENALAGLENAAKAGDDGTLSEASDAFDEWEKTLGGTLDDAAARVARESRELGSRGFEPLASALEEAVSDVDGLQNATEAAFETLIAKLGHEGDRFTGALTTATLAAQEAAEEAGELESDFEAKASQAIEAIQTSSGAAASVHGETRNDTSSFYDEVDSRIQSETDELVSDVAAAFEASAAAVRETAVEALDEPVETLIADALDPFVDEVASWAAQQESTAQTLADWDTLVRDLAASIEVIKTIKALDEAVS